jgi:hypothetical protein
MVYGEQLWSEKGEELSHLNADAMKVIAEGTTTFWIVDLLPLCE